MNTTSGTADESDYTAQKATAINFSNLDTNGTQKTVTIKTSTDAFTENKEYFYVDLFKTKADANDGYPYFDFATAYIANGAALASAARTYTVTNNSNSSTNANDEGSTVTFTISVDNNSAASKVYVSTVDGTAIAGGLYSTCNGSFRVGESSNS